MAVFCEEEQCDAWRKSTLDFLVQRMALESRIVFHFLDLFLLGFLVARRKIARGGFALLAGFRAFKNDEFARHDDVCGLNG